MEEMDTKTPEIARYQESSDDTDDNTEADDSSAKSAEREQQKSNDREWFGQDKAKDSEAEEPKSLYDLFEQHADPEPPLEELAADEQILVADETTDTNLDAANQELVGTEPGSPEEAAAIAGATFNEAVRERLDNGEAPSAETLDSAMKDTADILGLDSADISEEDPIDLGEATEHPDPVVPEVLDSVPFVEEEKPQLSEEPEPLETEPLATETEPADPNREESAEDTSDPAGPAGTGTPTPGYGPAARWGAHAAPGAPGTSGTPGGPPIPPFGPGAPAMGGAPFGGGGGPRAPIGFGPGVPIPVPAAPWMAPNVAAAMAAGNTLRNNRRHRHWPYVVAGGVAGYLIGRRRGRINTEKKLKPVQQRLEQQVGDLQFQLGLREAKIRKLAYEKAITHPHIHAALPKRLKELQELQKAHLKKDDFERVDRARDLVKGARGEEIVATGLAAKVATMAERDKKPSSPIEGRAHSPASELTRAKDMELSEVLDIAKQIAIEDRNLKILYESGRISQHGLRRVIEAYLRGERFDRILHEELHSGHGVENLQKLSSESDLEDLPSPMPTAGVPRQVPNNSSVDMSLDISDPMLSKARNEYYGQLTGTAEGNQEEGGHFPWVPVLIVGVIVGIVLIIFFA